MSAVQALVGPTVWRGSDFSGKGDVYIELGNDELDAIGRALERTESIDLEAIGRHHFSEPALDRFMDRISQEVLHGRGLVVLGGFPIDLYREDVISRIFWGIGRYFGFPVSQSVMGERLGHVVNQAKDDPHARGYRHYFELTSHTDFHDVVSFLCLQQGRAGGVSWFVSAHEVHNQILTIRPDLLDVLYRGFFTHRFGEQGAGEAPITEYRVPVFSNCEDRVSCRFIRRFIELAAHEGEALTLREREALDLLDELSMQPGVGLALTLEPGEAVIMNNYVIMHGRTAIAPQPGRIPSYDDHERRCIKSTVNVCRGCEGSG